MATLTTVTVSSRSPAAQLFGGQGSNATPIQVVNLDPNNTIYVGNTSNLVIGQAGIFPLEPLGSMSFDGSVSTYAITATGETAIVGIVPGGSNYSPGSLAISGPVTAEISGPVTISDIEGGTVTFTNDTINAIGDGGYILPGQVANAYRNTTTVTAPAGQSITIANLVDVGTYASIIFTQNGITASSVAAGAAVCAVWEFVWFDVNGNVIGTDAVSCLIGSQATWEIPCRGASFTLNFNNVGTVGTLSAGVGAVIVNGSFRAIPNVRVVSTAMNLAPVITGSTVVVATAPVNSVSFANISQWIASIAYSWSSAISSVVFPLPQWAGEVTGFYQVITTALAKNATIVDLSYALQNNVVSGSGYPYGIIQNIPSAIDTNPVDISFNLPPTQCALILDTPSSAGEFFLSLVGVGN